MALGAATIWDVRPTGSDANGGGFDNNVAGLATNLAATAANTSSPVVTSASYTFLARDVGHWLFVKAGTSWTPGWYQISGVSAGAATLAAGVGAGYLYDAGTHVPYAVTTAAGCATVASPSAGTWGLDYSQAGTAPFSYTDMVIDATTNTKFTSAANPVGPHLVGNLINVTGGTGFTVQLVEVVSVAGTVATCDKAMGTLGSTGGTGVLGGSLATPGMYGALKAVGGQSVFIANAGGSTPTAYTMSSTQNVSGGRVTDLFGGATALNPSYVIGWDTARHVLCMTANKPQLLANANSFTMITLSSNTVVRNLYFGNNGSFTSTVALFPSGNNLMQRIECHALGTAVTLGGQSQVLQDYLSDGCTTGIAGGGSAYDFVIRNSTGASITIGSGGSYTRGVIYNGANIGIQCSASPSLIRDVVVYKMTGGSGHGVQVATAMTLLENVISYGNSQRNYNQTPGSGTAGVIRCAGGGGGVADNLTPALGSVAIQLTADPFVNGGSGDFRLNTTPGGGPLLLGTGSPQAFQGLTPTNALDIGAYQSAGVATPVTIALNAVFRRRVR